MKSKIVIGEAYPNRGKQGHQEMTLRRPFMLKGLGRFFKISISVQLQH